MKQALRLIVAVLLSCSILSATGTVVTVADKAYLAQTSTPVTTVYTPTATGNFRACVYAATTTLSTDGFNPVVELEWTDEGNSRSESFMQSGSEGATNGCIPIRSLVSDPIKVLAYTGAGGVYDLFVTVERLP